ncbi:MAG: hypothetical protein GQ557_01145 [Mycoplasmataceae bacterium]|nr:hypothetical protein [Mycoplasmataceae bacterium]
MFKSAIEEIMIISIITILAIVVLIFYTRSTRQESYESRIKSIDKSRVSIIFDYDENFVYFSIASSTNIKPNQEIIFSPVSFKGFTSKVNWTNHSYEFKSLINKLLDKPITKQEADKILSNVQKKYYLFWSPKGPYSAKIIINALDFNIKEKKLLANAVITIYPNDFALEASSAKRSFFSMEDIFQKLKVDLTKSGYKKVNLVALRLIKSDRENIPPQNLIDFWFSFLNFLQHKGYYVYAENQYVLYIAKFGGNISKNPTSLLNKWKNEIQILQKEWIESININNVWVTFDFFPLNQLVSSKRDLQVMLYYINDRLASENKEYKKFNEKVDYEKVYELEQNFIRNFNDKNSRFIIEKRTIKNNKDFNILTPNISFEEQFYLNNLILNRERYWQIIIKEAIKIAIAKKEQKFILVITPKILWKFEEYNFKIPSNLYLSIHIDDSYEHLYYMDISVLKNIKDEYSISILISSAKNINETVIFYLEPTNIFLEKEFLIKRKQNFKYDLIYESLLNWEKNSPKNKLFNFE